MRYFIETLCFTVIFEAYLIILSRVQGNLRQAYKYPPKVVETVRSRRLIKESRLQEISRINKIIGFSLLLLMLYVIIAVINKETVFGYALLQSLMMLSFLAIVDLVAIRCFWMCYSDIWIIPGTEDIRGKYSDMMYYLKESKFLFAGVVILSLISAGIISLISNLF